MKSALRAFVSALAYFTVLPVGRFAAGDAPDAAALAALPIVGALVGLIAGTLAWGCSLAIPQPWPALLAFTATLILTGAIHVDGFLDACDALLATVSVEKRMEIINDPRHGTYAIAGFTVIVVAWIAALLGIPPAMYPFALAFAGATSRLAAIANARAFPYARGGAMTRTFEYRPNLIVMLVIFITIEAGAYWFTHDWRLLLFAPIAIPAALFIGWWSSRRLAGAINGDVYGLIVVKTEVLLLVAIAVLR